MISIIQHGECYHPKLIICNHCGCQFECAEEDIIYKDYFCNSIIECPECHNIVYVE